MKKIIPLAILLLLSLQNFAQQATDENAISGYLFAYFEGAGDNQKQEQLRFATSYNGTEWFALNN
ncbi:MAG: 1,4-beta-xylanase, partial [Sphingobacteriales bacterium]